MEVPEVISHEAINKPLLSNYCVITLSVPILFNSNPVRANSKIYHKYNHFHHLLSPKLIQITIVPHLGSCVTSYLNSYVHSSVCSSHSNQNWNSDHITSLICILLYFPILLKINLNFKTGIHITFLINILIFSH